MLSGIIKYITVLAVIFMTGNSGSGTLAGNLTGNKGTGAVIHNPDGDTGTTVIAYSPAGDSYIRVRGTSTLHDWEMLSDDVKGEIRLRINGNDVPGDVEGLMVSMEKTTLRSNQSGLNRRAYEAMNAGRHPEITFRMNGTGRIEDNGDGYIISARGNLTVAGQTRTISLEATCLNGDQSRLICKGSRKLRMSDFDIDPPVMMLGALRTGDEVTVDYRIIFSQ